MNIIWGIGEMAFQWAFPAAAVPIQGARCARTAYKVVKASACIFSGDFVAGGWALVSSIISLAGPSIGPRIPIPGISPEYLNCVNNCYREHRDSWTWMMAMCMASCESER